MMNTKEVYITDNTDSIIDRDETQAKLDRLKVYLRKVDMRVKQISRKKIELAKKDSQESMVEKGLRVFNLKSNVSVSK